ncbi:MAG: phytoene/squalene synthase family protein [Candidatus Liberibacter ctenarytainae]|uniref:Phytoene/squalene synthase family protein n=1 Tax=Candidatus Liberibacter ctenarytainae TaxID=2020335 RepID=A0A937DMD1_9HYPH|nr:phytoene/squalene synthase family protein [Candidatus Liberibacter ctenarytainae]
MLDLYHLRDNDQDRYLACLLSPSNMRISLAILYSFNAELMRVPKITSNPLTGEIRLQWWRDIFTVPDNDVSQKSTSPFADKLLSIIQKYDLPYQHFLDMIEARFFDLYADSMRDCAQLEVYAFSTASNLIDLAVKILDREQCSSVYKAIKHAGIAQSIGELSLWMSIHYSRGQLYIPLDILGASGLDRESFLSGDNKEKISLAISIFAEWGLDHLIRARKEIQHIPQNIFPAFLPMYMTGRILKNTQKNGAKILDNPYTVHQCLRQLYMLYSSVKKRF